MGTSREGSGGGGGEGGFEHVAAGGVGHGIWSLPLPPVAAQSNLHPPMPRINSGLGATPAEEQEGREERGADGARLGDAGRHGEIDADEITGGGGAGEPQFEFVARDNGNIVDRRRPAASRGEV